MDQNSRPFDVITFDCYGTLIDWESGIASAFLNAAREDGVTLDRDEVLRAYTAIEPAVEAEPFRSYTEVLTETALRVGKGLGWSLTPVRAQFLAASLPSWTPFPDTDPSLQRLRDLGYQLGILSNVDDILLELTCRHFLVPFDFRITAQQVRSYKPGHAHFLAAKERIGDARWLHVAQSNFHDIVPCNALGIPNAWVNRHREHPAPDGQPTFEVHDLTELTDHLARMKNAAPSGAA